MAEKILNTRILMKVDTLEHWNSSSLKLKKGELAFCTVAASAGTGLSEPVVMVKIGTEEEKTFAELPWAFHAKASDVLAACKTEAGLTEFVNGVIAKAGIATDEAMKALAKRVTDAEGEIDTLQADLNTAETGLKARMTAAEGEIDALQGLVGDGKVADQITTAINNLKLGETYAAKSLETTVANHTSDTVAHVTSEDKIKWNNALQATDVVTGSANGTISVKGSDVAVKGLGSAAYTEASAYDVSGAAAGALAEAKTYAEGQAADAESAAKSHAETKAADALAAAKTYAEGQASAAQTAAQSYADGKAADAEKNAKDYVNGLTGGESVSDYVSGVIANYSTTAQMTQAIATAKGEAVSHANGLNTAMDERVQALEAIDHTHSFVESELNLIKAGDVAKWNAAEQNAKDYADDLDDAMDIRMKAVEAKLGTGEGGVDAQIAAAVAAEAKLREDADAELQNAIDAIEADYLVEADKTALQGAIDALEELVGDEKVSEVIADEAKARDDADKALDAKIEAISKDYLVAADKTELEGKIKSNADAIALLTNGVDEKVVDGVNDLIAYVAEHGTEVTGMKNDIKANADAIDAIEADYLKAADKTELSGLITGLDTRMGAAETAIGTKAAQADLEALSDRVTTAEGKITGLEGDMTAAENAIAALEGLTGGTKVSDAVDAGIKALQDGQLKTMQGEIDAVEGRADALEAKAHEHANKAELDKFVDGDKAKLDAAVQTVTAGTGLKAVKTGTDVAVDIDETVTFIFDCGTSAE